MTYSEIIIHRIACLCTQQNLAYNKLANICNLNQSTIDNIVRGLTKNPRIITLHRIANGLGMTLSEFLDFDELNRYSFEEKNISDQS